MSTNDNKQPDERAASCRCPAKAGEECPFTEEECAIRATPPQSVKGDERVPPADCGCSSTMLYCSESEGCRLGLNEARAAVPQAVPLTDEQIVQAWKTACSCPDVGDNHECAVAMVRAILAAHNGGGE